MKVHAYVLSSEKGSASPKKQKREEKSLNDIDAHENIFFILYIDCLFALMFWTDTLPVQGKGLMVQRAEKCPYCDSYFLKNSSDFQQHIWAHQGVKTLRPFFFFSWQTHEAATHVGSTSARCFTVSLFWKLSSHLSLPPGCLPEG